MEVNRRHFLQSLMLLGIASKSRRSYAIVLQPHVLVTDFGAKGDGITDDTQAILKAVAVGKTVEFPAGVYLISDTITQVMAGQAFIGEGMQPYKNGNIAHGGSVIIQTNPNKDIFKSTEFGFVARLLHLTYRDRPKLNIKSPAVFNINNSTCFFDSIYIDVCPYGFKFTNVTGNFLTNVVVQNSYYCAFFVQNANDISINNALFVSADLTVNGSTTLCPNGVVWLDGFVQALNMTNVDIIGGKKSMTITGTLKKPNIGLGSMVAFCKFNNVYFDSSYEGVWIDKCVGMTFTNCWFSNRPGNGITIGGTFADNIKLIGCNIESCGSNGIVLTNTATNVLIDSCSIFNNSQSSVGRDNGIYVQSNTNYFSIINCLIQNVSYFTKAQGYGIFLDAGNSLYFRIMGNTFANNLNGMIKDNSNPTNQKIISGNFPIV